MSDFDRVKHPLFGEYRARGTKLKEVEVIDKRAVDANGRPLPAKPKTSAASKAAESKSKSSTNGDEPAAPEEKTS